MNAHNMSSQCMKLTCLGGLQASMALHKWAESSHAQQSIPATATCHRVLESPLVHCELCCQL